LETARLPEKLSGLWDMNMQAKSIREKIFVQRSENFGFGSFKSTPESDLYAIIKAEAKPVSPATISNEIAYKSALWKQYYELPGVVDMTPTKGDYLANLRKALQSRDTFVTPASETRTATMQRTMQDMSMSNLQALHHAGKNMLVQSSLPKSAMKSSMQSALRMSSKAVGNMDIQKLGNMLTSDVAIGTKPIQSTKPEHKMAFDFAVATGISQTQRQQPDKDKPRVYDIVTGIPPQKKTPEQTPDKPPWNDIVPDVKIPGIPPTFGGGTGGGGSGGGSGGMYGFGFTEKLVVKSAREMLFGKTNTNIKKKKR
jgi:hypothetical protein